MGMSQADVGGVTISAEIEKIEHVDLELERVLITNIAPKKISKFSDPFKYDPNEDVIETEDDAAAAAAAEESKTNGMLSVD